MSDLTCWTASDAATQPWLEAAAPDGGQARITATFVVGVWSSSRADVRLEVTASYASGEAFGVGDAAPDVVELSPAEFLRRDTLQQDPTKRREWLESVRHLVDVRADVLAQQQSGSDPSRPVRRFWAVRFAGLIGDRLMQFRATVHAGTDLVQLQASTETVALWLTDPGFTEAEVVGVNMTDADDQCWVLMHRRGPGLHQFRLDLLSTDTGAASPAGGAELAALPALPRIGLGFSNRTVELGSPQDPGPGQATAWLDRSTDSLHACVPATPGEDASTVTITTGTSPGGQNSIDVQLGTTPPQTPSHQPVGFMTLAYAIQGINDLFASRLSSIDGIEGVYDPPRSYGEVVWSDEQALFSGRPLEPENRIADGYAYALRAQRDYQVPAVWAFNAGALLLLRRSLSDTAFAELTAAVRDGWISPANAGFGAHRNCYYRTETNIAEIREGHALIGQLLGRAPDKVYFGDSRIYKAAPGETEAFAACRAEVETLVLDRTTVATAGAAGLEAIFPGAGPHDDHLWTDQDTGLRLLLIDRDDQGHMMNATPVQMRRGQVLPELRRALMASLVPTGQGKPSLHVVADDIEHFCGAGWFDGSLDFADGYLAALCWISQHPWVHVWTPDQPGFADLAMETPLKVQSAIDAGMVTDSSPGTLDGERVELVFDHAYEAWRGYHVDWLDCTLADLNDRLEAALAELPDEPSPLQRLARLYYLPCTHESFWSKQPEGSDAPPPAGSPGWDPEDFVVSESVQLRNAWVFLNADLWASWAAQAAADGPDQVPTDYLMSPDRPVDRWGPLGPMVLAAKTADAPHARAAGPDGLYWDQDNLPNVILYNAHLLAVIDQNGGVITHLFARHAGRAISVSGTPKAHQYLTLNPQVAADGPRLQNTVLTPNHLYLGSDVSRTEATRGSYTEQTLPLMNQPCWYPNNFDRYPIEPAPEPAGDPAVGPVRDPASVRFAYAAGPAQGAAASPAAPLAWTEAREQLRTDGEDLRAGLIGRVDHVGDSFTKTIELTGRTLRISYQGTDPGHLVGNEFTLDLLAQLTEDRQQRRVGPSSPDGAAAIVSDPITGDPGLTATVRPELGCRITNSSSLPDPIRDLERRVLTDTVFVESDQADFSYAIEISHQNGEQPGV